MKIKLMVALAVLTMALAGCAATPTAPPTPSAPPIMTIHEAAAKYMTIVCPGNAAAYLLTFAYDTKEPARIKAAAINAWRAAAREAEQMNDTGRWPADARSDLRVVAVDLSVYSAHYAKVANAATLQGMLEVASPIDTAAGAAAEDLRAKLHLPVIDPATSCDSTPLVVRASAVHRDGTGMQVALP